MAIAYKAGMIDSAVTEWTVYNGEMAPGAQQRVVNYAYTTDKLNRISVHDTAAPVQTTSYTPNALNQYTNVGGAGYNYDAKFNLTWATGFSAAYDAANRMVSASNASMAVNAEVELVYDGLGRCVKRTIDNVTTIILYDDWKPIAEWDGWTEDYFQAWNVYGPGADEILLRHEAKMGYIRYHSDPNGNVKFLLDNDGAVVEKYTYDVFGRPKIMGAGGEERASCHYNNRFLFQGREYIDEIGVYDYRNRFYHPELGRFLQVDPTGFDAGDMNLFRYCGDDPIDGSDPTGLTAFLPDRIWEMARYMDSSNMAQGLFQEQMLRQFPAGMDGGDKGSEGRSGGGESKSLSRENEGSKRKLLLVGAAIAAAADGPLPIGDVVATALVITAADAESQRVWVTYTLRNSGTGQTYVGRASGFGSPQEIVQRRFASHHMRAAGFRNPQMDRAYAGPLGYPVTRGREQQLMNAHGGVGSPGLANQIRGVSRSNPAGPAFHNASSRAFGEIAPYDGYW
jgi:RHS repeat-associated protein